MQSCYKSHTPHKKMHLGSQVITCCVVVIIYCVNHLFEAAESNIQQNNHQQRRILTKENRRFSRDSSSGRERRPNIVFILTDDQDVELGSLNFMPRTLKLMRDGGAEFRHAYTTTPMCCPARSSLLTGMYVHNHMVFTNNDNCSSPQWQATHETRSYATYLSNAGYRTGYFGKYLNKYNGSYIPPGWREWGGLIMNSKYYNYSINLNGQKIKHGFDFAKDYYPDLIANDSIAFLRSSKQQNQRKPVLLTMSFPAPHGPEDSAPQYRHLFFNVTTHHTPSYDHAPNPDKQWILRATNRMQPVHKRFTNLLMTKRLQTLQSVDVAVERIFHELKALGELDNTYIVYTSDHGYHLGQFGLIKGKSFPFEFDVRVPFLMRGPGIQAAQVVNEIVLNVDLAPTFLDIGGVPTPSHMDGRSILPLLLNRNRFMCDNWPDSFLIESSGRRETVEQISESRARLLEDRHNMKLANSTLLEDLLIRERMSTSNTEVMLSDSIETTTTPTKHRQYVDGLDSNTEDDDDVDGAESYTDSFMATFEENEPLGTAVEYEASKDKQEQDLEQFNLPLAPYITKMMRLNSECSDPALLTNCLPGQKWKCINEEGRWRKHKCKFHLQLEHQLVTMPRKHSQRNCACFTTDGLIYTKIRAPSSTGELGFQRLNKRTHGQRPYQNTGKRRHGRETYHEEISYEMEKLLDLDHMLELITKHGHRNKRYIRSFHNASLSKPVSHASVARVIQQIQSTLETLERKFMERELSNRSTSIDNFKPSDTRNANKFIRGGTRCYVEEKRDLVNCSDVVYKDEKSWHKLRNQIDMLIRLLKEKISALKDMKKQMRESKVKTVTSSRRGEVHRPEENSARPIAAQDSDSELNIDYFGKMLETPRELLSTTSREHDKETLRSSDIAANIPLREPTQITPSRYSSPAECYCESDVGESYADSKEMVRMARRKLKEERQRKKERKRIKKARLEKECLSEKMNCFSHDNQHWRTAPFWNDSPFCFCMNANNNTYSCLRTINITHNFLYCEFTTGLVTFYNLKIESCF
ncbi:extracellular sulfatase SULF-1 homolog isoform X2 [Drosophila busckii]|uniref:extracellular sulfatase SULF-1 homolog isoform X2 n=1 Tax=Drosophila busckii TaxID=30019 RepID=UPI00083EC14B|nr:extracellular sulfatase SULF-1 homolog isoform X2 [Drosophila busckii]